MSRILWQPRLWLVCLMAGIGHCSAFAQAPSAPAPFGKYTENINGVTLELVRIPNGKFIMGNDRSPNPEEKPAHQVNIKSVYMGRYEVTRQQWNWVVDNLPKINRSLNKQYIGPIFGATIYESNPVDEIFWVDAVEFCERLSKYTGRKYRLPSEAEWEYACRAGTATEYSWGDTFDPKLANIDRYATWHLPVGQVGYQNNWGFFDSHGNVGEMCADHEHKNYLGAPIDGSAWVNGGDANSRVLRGGSNGSRVETGRSFYRGYFLPIQLRASGFGFRVVGEIVSSIGTGSIAATSAANYLPQNLSANSLGSLFGERLAAETTAATTLPLPTSLAGVSVFVKDVLGNEHLAQLLFVSPTQINFQMPADLPTGTATIYAVLNGNIHSSGTINIVNTSPGLFTADATGKGFAAAVVQRVKSTGEATYEAITRFDPAQNRIVALPIDLASRDGEEVFLALFGTGIRGRSSLVNVTAQIGASPVEVLYAGVQPDFAGLDQINLRLPKTLLGSGEVSINVSVDGLAANPVKIQIR